MKIYLNPEQIGIVTGWMKAKNIFTCQVCKIGVFQVEPEVLELKCIDPNEGKSLVIGGIPETKIPVIGIICSHCGVFLQISAVRLGFFPPLGVENQKENKPEENQDQKQEQKLTIN